MDCFPRPRTFHSSLKTLYSLSRFDVFTGNEAATKTTIDDRKTINDWKQKTMQIASYRRKMNSTGRQRLVISSIVGRTYMLVGRVSRTSVSVTRFPVIYVYDATSDKIYEKRFSWKLFFSHLKSERIECLLSPPSNIPTLPSVLDVRNRETDHFTNYQVYLDNTTYIFTQNS